ncbi:MULTISPECIES: winged helix-turn-helix domain-containing protein [Anaerotruncus]|uniref:Stage 0 sporulation protein A homolog n=2 Tax=Anaerotruncus TaxID=244127 RepID=A0A498CRP1_9FIRM|nr:MULTISPECIES: response regulator transcription factor [Anaerotruncus]MBC3938681.1 response regulator transcription factor [Anaerotruncus massiliensis (ex Togo et al. 2019)]MCQ4896562.1 response regulator transcription factor [Anaerotruncus sp. DFI.9.16]RLL11653.1 DNA-binding response regulator [Anaerotruncus massiliensis (ex Liu et al. 2021)]
MAARVYLVEDDESIRELVLYALASSGYEARGFERADAFWEACDALAPSLVLLDIMLPGDDGLAILRRMKESVRTADIPVIMLTARATEYDKVKGLDAGADDYVTKPFGVMELLSRVRAVLRRAGPGEEPAPLLYGEVSLDPGRRAVTAAGEPVALTYKEFELLAFLLKNQGLVLTRERIMERVWGFDYEGESRTVDMHIKSLRHKLGACGEIIRTVRGVGYKIGE